MFFTVPHPVAQGSGVCVNVSSLAQVVAACSVAFLWFEFTVAIQQFKFTVAFHRLKSDSSVAFHWLELTVAFSVIFLSIVLRSATIIILVY